MKIMEYAIREESITTHYNPFDDLVLDEFEKQAIEKFGIQKNNKALKLLTLLKGYYGIRYYDPLATGEEYVLLEEVSIFHTSKKSHILLESIML
jgi:hypothetical protein